MRIALVSASFLPAVGGAEHVVHHLAVHWTRQGHEVRVLNCVTDEVVHPDGNYSVGMFRQLRGSERFGYHRSPFLWYAVRGMRRQLVEFQPDYISAHMGYPAALWLSKIEPRPRFFVTCHGGELTKFYWGSRARYHIDGILRESLNSAAGVIAISRHARFLMEELGVEPGRILDIPNGLELERFAKKVDFDLRDKLGIPRESRVILSVGREHPQKAYDTGIRAFAQVAARIPEAYYVIVGRNTGKWAGLAEELNVRDRVVFAGQLYGDEVVGVYQQADVFFSPSIWEMLALVVLEAMASGLPAVVTNISGSQDVIRTGENGIVVEPGHAEEMAEALVQLLRDESMRKRLGQANLERAAPYSWERISRLYLEHR
jgi:glycosyltransferase involved in cell wall biosynthesis